MSARVADGVQVRTCLVLVEVEEEVPHFAAVQLFLVVGMCYVPPMSGMKERVTQERFGIFESEVLVNAKYS